MNSIFVRPQDILFLRGNQHFGTAGAHGAALMPPWPSLMAGAIRSRLIAEGETVESLANFCLTRFGLARQASAGDIEALLPLPGDVMVSVDALTDARYAIPTEMPASITSSYDLPTLPSFCLDKPAKAIGGLWLNAAGIRAWLTGAPIVAKHLVQSNDLWRIDPRLGIALDAQKRSAAEGKIYTAEAVAFANNIGFIASYSGAAKLPDNAMLRLGGDGRSAITQNLDNGVSPTPTGELPPNDLQRIAKEGRFRLLLTTPGVFADGWKPNTDDIPATLVAASVGRAETISGWDLLTNKPKAAQRVAPAGSVYWFDKLASTENLATLLDNAMKAQDAMRHAEGFNHYIIAPWAQET